MAISGKLVVFRSRKALEFGGPHLCAIPTCCILIFSFLSLLALLRPNPIPVPSLGVSNCRFDFARLEISVLDSEEMSNTSSSVAIAGVMDSRPPFTAAQWQELEHQALIYKYLVAGLPVPPDLLVPIRRSLESLSARFFHHSALGYCSYYGKKIDPEPGRCRRTDGKKWRCSKDAYPDSKYCERHMHRGRNRSRKLVESQSSSQSSSSSSSSSTVASSISASSGGSGCFQSLPFHSIASSQEGSSIRSGLLKLQMESSPYESTTTTDKEFRYFQGLKPESYEPNLSLEGSGSIRVLGQESNVEDSWRLMPSSNSRYGSCLQNETPQLYMRLDHEPINHPLMPKQQHFLFRSDISSIGKEEHHAMRAFLDEGPTGNKGLWPNFDGQRYNNNNNKNKSSFSNTQLSISVPESSSDVSTRNSSPNDP